MWIMFTESGQALQHAIRSLVGHFSEATKQVTEIHTRASLKVEEFIGKPVLEIHQTPNPKP